MSLLWGRRLVFKFYYFCAPEIELLAAHGILLPPNMQGLTDEQVRELSLKDDYAETCKPSGGHVFNKDPVGRRNGQGDLLAERRGG